MITIRLRIIITYNNNLFANTNIKIYNTNDNNSIKNHNNYLQ